LEGTKVNSQKGWETVAGIASPFDAPPQGMGYPSTCKRLDYNYLANRPAYRNWSLAIGSSLCLLLTGPKRSEKAVECKNVHSPNDIREGILQFSIAICEHR